MSGEDTRELVQELVRDLEPVRPIARLRYAAGVAIGLWLVVAVLGIALMGLRPDWSEMLLAQRAAGWIFGALALAGLAGVVAGLALGVPGREGLVRIALAVGVLGLALSAGIASVLVWRSPAGGFGAPGSGELGCLAIACAVGLLPALSVVAFLGRAAAFRPLASVLAAAAGTAALGSLAAEASCLLSNPLHVLLGHVLAPVAGVLLLTLPLLIALRRISR